MKIKIISRVPDVDELKKAIEEALKRPRPFLKDYDPEILGVPKAPLTPYQWGQLRDRATKR
jgi:hypothetical protein